MSTNPTRDDYIRELTHKHQFLIVSGLFVTLLFCGCIIVSANDYKLQLLAVILAIVVFYGAVLSNIMVKQVNKVTVSTNRMTELWREVRDLREQVARLQR
ncbi:hypothetical protein BU25DRAFT_461053 [Macroventuria anomochaeta]|uniref:Uncharacterized protein n=1 Tax=Macroventuria anomochaeta TaxID=301207 RepID=A0ACB6RRJ4_9PLEO|nr:uncharacterized protein BU25DRAFT_461053 [Macroventuria anomochaeta]KAF2624521.1 hypothetical protein BU25DRAFT_461053 [Macroventuria anomochaeta]